MRIYYNREPINAEVMCLAGCSCLLDFLPYIFLVTIPFFGSFCGIEIILRLSLLIYLYTVASAYIPRFLHYVIPYLNLGVLCLIVIYVPVNIIPFPVIWLYNKILWLSDPVLLTIEVVLALNFVMHCSRRAAEQIEEDEDEAWKWKLLLTVFSALCYAIMVSIGIEMYRAGTNIQFWMLLIVSCSSIVLAAHNMMWMSHVGIISDVAFTSLCSMVIIYTMREEVNIMKSPLQKPSSWYTMRKDESLLQVLYHIINTSLENSRVAVQFLKQYMNPLFVTLLGVRLYSILFLIQRVIKNFNLEDEDSFMEEEIESNLSPWRSPLIVKCSIIYMITQTTQRLFYQCSGKSILPSWWSGILDVVWPRELLFGRLLQIIVVNMFYIWRLYCADDWQWSAWFSA